VSYDDWKDRRWRADAVCAQIGGDLWFPDRGSRSKARDICETCPVRRQCFEFAVNSTDIYHGVWGGETISTIRAERRKRKLRETSVDDFVESILGVVKEALEDENDE
jgi:WhiB family redox-sensing transcriptional regulator